MRVKAFHGNRGTLRDFQKVRSGVMVSGVVVSGVMVSGVRVSRVSGVMVSGVVVSRVLQVLGVDRRCTQGGVCVCVCVCDVFVDEVTP